MIEIQEYLREDGRSPFGRWFNGLSREAAAKVAKAMTRMEMGNLSSVKGLKAGVLGGGTKKRQQNDIETAITLWQEYKDRKRRR